MGSDNTKYAKPTKVIKLSEDANSFVQSPNGEFTAIGLGRNQIGFYKTDYYESPLIILEGCTYSWWSNGFITPQFSHNSNLFAFRWNEKIRIMNTETLKIVKEIDNRRKWETIAFSHDDRYIAVGHFVACRTDYINVYDLTKDSSMAFVGKIEAQALYAVRSKYEENMLKIEPIWHKNRNELIAKKDSSVNIYSVNENGIAKINSLGHPKNVKDFQLSPCGRVLTVSTNKNISLWNYQTKQLLANVGQIKGRSDPGYCTCYQNVKVAFSQDGKFFATADKNTCFIYRTLDLQLQNTFTLPKTIHNMKFSPQGTYLGIGFYKGYYIYNRNTQHGFYTKMQTSKRWQTIDCIWSQDESTLLGRYKEKLGIFKIIQLDFQDQFSDDEEYQNILQGNEKIVVGRPVQQAQPLLQKEKEWNVPVYVQSIARYGAF